MTCNKLIGIILFGPSAVKTVRAMVGCTDSLDAKPGTIRGDYGTFPIYRNLVHASDSVEAAKHEIKFFFDDTTDLKRPII